MKHDLNLPGYEDLLAIGLNALPEGENRTENSFYYPVLSAFALMGNDQMVYAQLVYNSLFAENLTSSELEAFISDRTSITRRLATRTRGKVTFTGAVGTYIDQGVQVASGDHHFFTMYGDTIKQGGTVEIDVQAVDVGNIGYYGASTIDTLVTTVPGVTDVTNTEPLISGMDEESDESLLSRYRWQLKHFPYNLNNDTFVEWASDVDNVGQVRVVGQQGNLNIKIYALDTDFQPADEEIVNNLQAMYQQRDPYGFSFTVAAPTKEAVNVNVKVREADASLSTQLKEALERYLRTYPDPRWVRTELSIWEVINVIEKETDMDNITDISIGNGASVYRLSATDGSKLLTIGNVNVTKG